MKSYFLEELADEQQARDRLGATLPGQSEPWLLSAADGDPIAYFDIVTLEDDGGLAIMANVSGRHYEKDEVVLTVLRALRQKLGGTIRDDFDNDLP
ncbi:hypothetical protein [Mesorhizobium loti]|uniref:Uncharacterized protein n=1 Tax=Mesorhizobium loti R88b TaxID=935548 RepID=A0A6M7WKC5_RHILI|nr:hypothetical protein [Mesorhizobium loti]QKD02982.1 hypothetical protein EB235_16940 [Mesorhizobium loti R88b]